MKDEAKVRAAVNRILQARDFSLNAAETLTSAILAEFPDDERLEDTLDVLAQYVPGGGQYLYDEQKLEAECRRILQLLPS